MAAIDLHSPDISCARCKANIEGDLGGEPGVRSVVVDVAARQVQIDFDEQATGAGVLRAKLAEIGYPAS
ncbi:MAG: heavy-metal-associated domain-containing protein [Acidimicrobiales bacterium]